MKTLPALTRLTGNSVEDWILALLLITAIFLATSGVRSCYAHGEHASSQPAAHATIRHSS